MKISSLRMEFNCHCHSDLARAALSASVDTLEELSVRIGKRNPKDRVPEDRVKVLEKMLPLMAQLRTVRVDVDSRMEPEKPGISRFWKTPPRRSVRFPLHSEAS